MKQTSQSEYGTLQRVIIKRAADAFIDQTKISSEWRALNFLSEPSFANAQQEAAAFEKILKTHAAEVNFLPAAPTLSLDSIYCRDASIATDRGIILCNMGKDARKPEPAACAEVYHALGITILGQIQSPGTVEGGDVAWLDQNTLAVGRTYRTNDAGIDQLKKLLSPAGVNVMVVPLPHYRGPADVFHLMSIFSPVDKNLAVVYSPLMPIPFREELLARGYSFVEVPEAEFDTMGCNVLALGPRKCLMVKGNPIARQRLLEAGCEVIEYEGTDISYKGGGGPTCLTRPLQRLV